MALPKHVQAGIFVALFIAIVVGVLAYMHLSSPRRRTVVVAEPRRSSVDEAAARKEVERRIADIRANGEPIAVADFKPRPVPPGENYAEPLMAAMKWLDRPEVEKSPVWEIELAPRMSDAQWRQVDAAVAEFAPALLLIEQADGRTVSDWNIDFKSPALNILLPSLNGARRSATLLRMAALSAHRAGRHDEAVRRIEQMVTLARQVDTGHPALVGHLVACGISRLATQTIADVTPTLRIAGSTGAAVSTSPTSPAARAVTQERVAALIALLLDPSTLHAGLRSSNLAERMFLYDMTECLLDGRLAMESLFKMMGGRQGQEPVPPLPPRGEILADLSLLLDHVTRLVEASRATRLPEFRKLAPPATGTPNGHTLLPRLFTPAHDGAARTHYQAVTHLNLAAAALATRWWSVDHAGAMPPSLEVLVPRYLPAGVPADPLSAAPAELQYQAGPSPMIFSAGVDERKRPLSGAATTKTVIPDFAIKLSPSGD